MKKTTCFALIVILLALAASPDFAQNSSTRKREANKAARQPGVAPAATNPVTGSGSPGQLTKWTGVEGTGTFTIGDSNITEDKFGKVGIGTRTPTSLLSVQGMIETTLGGYKFPDGTIQTTAALGGLQSVFRDLTLQGNGTAASLLGIAAGGVNTLHLANNAVTATKIANGTVVRSVNGLLDNVNLAAGTNITITPSGNTLTIAAVSAPASVTTNPTLQGNGTAGSPLGVAVPVNLTGASASAILRSRNTVEGGIGVMAEGGNGNFFGGGDGLFARGGNGSTGIGGNGAVVDGGTSNSSLGGNGIIARGGTSNQDVGGNGVFARGGDSSTGGGKGVFAQGGNSINSGGVGVYAVGGSGSGSGNLAGNGIFAFRGMGFDGATDGLAGSFMGDVSVTGNLSKGGGSFKIDHPLDPENKYLYHSFVESPDMMNIYNGTVTTDQNGEAVVEMPAYFEALNRDFRYQLTVIGQFAQAIVGQKIKGNHFRIMTSAPNVEVSWQVTGVRQDAFANQNRIEVEVEKAENERGFYLHPEAFHQPAEKNVLMVQYPEIFQQLKQQRLEKEQRSPTPKERAQ
jgi:hypothetical protein